MLLCQIRAAPWVREAAACGSRPPIAPRLADGDSQGMRVAYAFEATRLARRHPAARRATLSRWPVVAGIGCAHAELARSTVARSCTASWAATVVEAHDAGEEWFVGVGLAPSGRATSAGGALSRLGQRRGSRRARGSARSGGTTGEREGDGGMTSRQRDTTNASGSASAEPGTERHRRPVLMVRLTYAHGLAVRGSPRGRCHERASGPNHAPRPARPHALEPHRRPPPAHHHRDQKLSRPEGE